MIEVRKYGGFLMGCVGSGDGELEDVLLGI